MSPPATSRALGHVVNTPALPQMSRWWFYAFRLDVAALALTLCACSSSSGPTMPLADATPADMDRPPTEAGAHSDGGAYRDANRLHDATRDTLSPADAPREAAPDARSSTDATPDSPARTFDAPPFDAPPSLLCPGGRNVFAVSESQPGYLGAPSITLTNLDAIWGVSTGPLDITATPGSGASLSLILNPNGPGATLTPGTYTQGATTPDGGVSVDLAADGDLCGGSGGSFKLIEITQSDAGVTSILATFTLDCGNGSGSTDPVTGCVRYEAQVDTPDASVTPVEAGYDAGLAPDAGGSLLAPCLMAPQAFYVTGSPVAATPERITGSQGDWSAGNDGFATLNVEAANRWALTVSGEDENGIVVGMPYRDAGILPGAPERFALIANGVNCGSPSASFTVYDYADTGGDEATVTRLAATFQATCTVGEATGTVSGCVHYVE